MRKMKSKMPENVFEAQLLEMAGAAKGEDEVYSDDSEYDANFIDDEEDGEGGFQHPQKPGKLHTNVFCFFCLIGRLPEGRKVDIPLGILPHVREQNKYSYFARPGQS